MKTVWDYSIKTEAERLVQCAHQISIGFYKSNNFIVLPYNPNTNNTHTVIFPDIEYNKISRFWEQSKKVNVDYKLTADNQELVRMVLDQIGSIKLKSPNYIKIKDLWSKAESKVISEIFNILPTKKNKVKKITIFPTIFGTNCSFSWNKDTGSIFIYLREDQGIHAITEAIITSITRDDVYKKLEGLWQESEILADFLVTETTIAKVLQKYESAENYIPTLKGIRFKERARLIKKSEEFYKKLGIRTSDKPFSFNGLVPEFFDNPITNLSEMEKKVLLNLIKNSNIVVEFDDIGNLMFNSEDNFSLYAISKMIQRLRDKLEANGISGSHIQTLRGKGYLLKN